jgi:hypothetical protein
MTAADLKALGVMLLVAIVVMILDSCSLTVRERGTLDDWLVCEDCMDGELDSVVALAVRKPNATRDHFISALLNGPDAVQVVHLENQLTGAYAQLADYVGSTGGVLAEAQPDYIERFRQNFVDVTRKRAAIALKKIGGAAAMEALDSAAAGAFPPTADTLRPDVLEVVTFARDTLAP